MRVPHEARLNGFHLLGEIQTCADSVFVKLCEIVCPLFEAVPGQMRIVIPPQPRYVFGGCCADPTHGPNSRMESYPETRMTSFSALQRTGKFLISTFQYSSALQTREHRFLQENNSNDRVSYAYI